MYCVGEARAAAGVQAKAIIKGGLRVLRQTMIASAAVSTRVG